MEVLQGLGGFGGLEGVWKDRELKVGLVSFGVGSNVHSGFDAGV